MDNMKHKPIQVTPHLFQLGTRSFPVYLSMGEEGMIIEGGTGATFDIITSQIESLGIDPMKIKTIVLTHTHPDHIGAVPRFRQIWKHVKVLAGPVAGKNLKRENFVKEFLPADRMIGKVCIESGDIKDLPPLLEEYRFEADAVIGENDRIDLGGGVVWRVFETPGHSPCHISLHEEKERTMVLGDITGYYEPKRDAFWPNYFHSLEDYCGSIRRMMAIPSKRALLSHNGVIEGDVTGYLEKALMATEAYHHELMNKLNRGEQTEEICREKADWVWDLGPLASYKAIAFLCGLLLKNSMKENVKNRFTPSQAEAA